MAQEVYTTQQVADIVGVHKNTVLNWIKTGKMDDVRRDWKRHRIWTKRDLQRLIEIKNKFEQLTLEITK